MKRLHFPELRATFLSGAGDEMAVTLQHEAEGGLSIGISCPAIEQGRGLSANDLVMVGQCVQELALYEINQGGTRA